MSWRPFSELLNIFKYLSILTITVLYLQSSINIFFLKRIEHKITQFNETILEIL